MDQPMRIVLLMEMAAPYGGCHFEKPFQTIRVVLLIANGAPSPYVGCHFLGRIVFRVGRPFKFLRNILVHPERSPDLVVRLVL